MYRPLYKGRLPVREARLCVDAYLVPARGFLSLSGVFHSLLHAVNYDRVKKGMPPLEADALDSTFLHNIPKADWMMPDFLAYLVFEV